MSFDLIPEPQSVTLKGEAADSDDAGAPVPVALPLVGRISEDRDIDDIAGVFPTQLADDIEAATGLRWDIASDVMVPDCPRQMPRLRTRFRHTLHAGSRSSH